MSRETDCTFTLNDGRKLGFAEYGVPDGKPLFFFHGWPGSRLSGSETDAAAKELGVRVISTDRPGVGLSDFQKDRKLIDWPNDVGELADHLQIGRFSIMGVSGGGPYAAVCGYSMPDRIEKVGIVVGLAPVDAKGILDGMSFLYKMGWANYHAFPILQTLGAMSAAVQYKYLAPRNQLGTREAFRQGIKGASHELKVYTDDWGFKLRDIKSKVYLWYGTKDKNAPLGMGKYYESQIPGSTLFIDKNGDHYGRYNFEKRILKILTA